MLALQGVADPIPGSSQYYPGKAFRLIVLDAPQTMNLVSGDGQSRRSGTDLPLGEPSTEDVHVLGTAP